MTEEQSRFWSVTTLLDLALARPALISWAARAVAETAVDRLDTLRQMVEKDGDRQAAIDFLTGSRWRKRAAILKRGSQMHAAAEQLALGVTPDVPEDVLPYVQQYALFLEEFRPVFEMAEAPVYHLEHGYAGTLDGIVRIDGEPYVVDYKSHDKPLDATSRPPYPDVALQLVAYQRSSHVAIRGSQQRNYNGRRYYVLADGAEIREMPKTAGALALAISPYDYQLVPVRVDDEIFDFFLVACDMARWELEIASRVLGSPIAPSTTEVTA